MDADLAAKIRRVGKLRQTGDGRCRVLGIDRYSGEDWIAGTFDSPAEALQAARSESRRSISNATDASVSTVYYAYDPEGNYLGGDVWDDVSAPFPATAIIVDLRNFTPSLLEADVDADRVNFFCRFLAEFYGLCLDACLVAMPPTARQTPQLYTSSTGDGMLMVFGGTRHIKDGYLATLALHTVLNARCFRFNRSARESGKPTTGVGIGVEAGEVSRIRALVPSETAGSFVDTCIGNCINVAARIETLTKNYGAVRTIVGAVANEQLCFDLFGKSYSTVVQETRSGTITEKRSFELHDELTDLNRRLCVSYIHRHVLKGVKEPLPLFRLSSSRAQLGNPHFESLLKLLAVDSAHHAEVQTFLKGHTTQSSL